MRAYKMQRWLSGLRRTIGNRVMQECIRRFKSSSLRHQKAHLLWVCFFGALSRACKTTELSEVHARSVSRNTRLYPKAVSDNTLLQRNNFPLLCAKRPIIA